MGTVAVSTDIERVLRQVSNDLWALQGRINALQLVAMLSVLDHAKTQPHPFQWIQDYLAAMRVTMRGLTADVEDPSKGDRTVREMRGALEEFLAELLSHAGQLKGAPGNPEGS